ncbi:MAG: hypothetical protein AB8C46_03460 [Burkholderiaceae bacterium]
MLQSQVSIQTLALNQKAPPNAATGTCVCRLAATLAVLLFVSACSTLAPDRPFQLTPSASPVAQSCLRWLHEFDAVVIATKRADARASRVPGFAHLRINRPLLQLERQISTPKQEARWLGLLSRLALEARTAELANLPESAMALLRQQLPDQRLLAAMSSRQPRLARAPAPDVPAVPANRIGLLETAANCHQLLLAYDVRDNTRAAAVRETAHVPDHYSTPRRALGVYGITKFGVAAGIKRWEQQTLQAFAQAEAQSGSETSRRFFGGQASARPIDSDMTARLLTSRRTGPLGRPVLTEQVEQWLLQTYLPVFEIERLASFDDPGRVRLDERGQAFVDTTEPSIYTRVAYTNESGRQLIQLIYTVWFSERPARRAIDIYAGRLDGVTVRITLNEKGLPAVIDSIHPCGCYHLFFHTVHARALSKPASLGNSEEWRFMPTTPINLPDQGQPARLHVAISSGEHYIRRVWFQAASTEVTKAVLLPEDSLSSLALGELQQRRSLFGPDGIVPGTDRKERWILWPMGIKSAGAMRQRGTQATAFVGRRHFDDGDIIDSRFDIP